MRKVNIDIFVAVWVFIMALTGPAVAVTHYVWAGESIQAAIDDANNGDEIEVSPGTYYEAINFNGKAIRLYSSGGRDVTTIDANGVYHAVQCVSGEGPDTVLEGFTITGGNANGPSSEDRCGGGMYNYQSSPTVMNCTFTGNMAFDGAGIYNFFESSPTVTNCTFTGNTAYSLGGGMYNNNSSPMVTNCTFSSNSAEDYGGGMFNEGSSPTVSNCTFSGNSAGYGGSGGMYNYYGSYPTVTNCILWGDTGGIEIADDGSTTTVTYSDVEGGTGQSWFGTGCIDAAPCFVDAAGGDLRLRPISPCIDAGDNNSMSADTADLDGDGNTVEPIPFDADGRTRVVDGDNDGTAVVEMGAFEAQLRVQNITQDTWYIGIQAAIDDANDGDKIEVTPGTHYETVNFNGKAIAVYSSDGPDVTTINGSGYYHVVQCISGEDANTILEGFTITDGNANGPNQYEQCGGGMLNVDSSPTVTNCTFTGNSVEYGGGMYNSNNSSPMVTNCTFSANEAVTHGGGMFNNNSSPTVTDCNFIGNTTLLPLYGDGGGGMFNSESSPTVTNCTFSGNWAEVGGGMSNGNNSNPMVTGCNFSGNTAEGGGGGMFNSYDSSPMVTDCRFSGNSAAVGGGMLNHINTSPTVTNCTFSGNTASHDGGGMHNATGSSPTVINCIFSGNSADDVGGGMHNYSSSPTLINCTLSGNSAMNGGGGVYNFNNSFTATNCIFWGNRPDEFFNNSSTPTVTYSDVLGGHTGTGNIDVDPCFVDANNPDPNLWNLRLKLDSACIDAGDSTAVPGGVTNDRDDRPRFTDGDCNDTVIVDMGAYEFAWAYIGDFDGECDVDFVDFAIFALAWLTEPGQTGWNPDCDISIPADNYINWDDLDVVADNWLAGTEP